MPINKIEQNMHSPQLNLIQQTSAAESPCIECGSCSREFSERSLVGHGNVLSSMCGNATIAEAGGITSAPGGGC